MKILHKPARAEWSELVRRPLGDSSDIAEAVNNILALVRKAGDTALVELAARFDHAAVTELAQQPVRVADNALAASMQHAIGNIRKFHEGQTRAEPPVEVEPGVTCWRKSVAIERVGLYIPAGTAPLFSSLMMLAVPAQIAGCHEIVVCSPPGRDGKVHPMIGHTAHMLDIPTVYAVGGAQAIAAMAYGTETVPRVDKIFGPGNRYVTRAKQEVAAAGISIDMPAGPSEVLVIADDTTDPNFVAADLLSQAEHGVDSQVVCVSWSVSAMERIMAAVEEQLQQLPRRAEASGALARSIGVLVNDAGEAMEFSNIYAPEHLILNCTGAAQLADQVSNAGSVFIGPYSCESLGDYASGTNHTLPTNGLARAYSGVSVDSFVKKITFQEVTKEGIQALGPVVEQLAQAEELEAHKRAVSVRLNSFGHG